MAILPIIKKAYQNVEVTSSLTIIAFLTCAISRYNRKMVTCVGLFLYSFFSFGCTFIPQQGFWLFTITRLFVAAMAESCLATVPLVIADLFHPEKRTVFARVYGTTILDLASQHWRYTTPALGLFGLVLAIIIMKEPEGMDEEEDEDANLELDCSCFSDLKKLLTNCSFLTFTAGVLCYAFVYGANISWVNKLFKETRKELHIKTTCLTTGCNYDNNMFYGVINCATNLIGLIIGTEFSKRYKKSHPEADAVLCGIGLILCAPILMLFIVLPKINFAIAYVSEALMKIFPKTTKPKSMQFAMTIMPVVAVIGAVFFFIAAYRIKKKKKKKMAEMPTAIIIQK
ncbi:hypothetical protein XELAEV_18018786mg [Xenopus laevis]|uniref:Major facilitator superfamily (MFS) profile domain-containing protein n=1 Tax=Xenopus laevis TaxID=8355 RepID=A0A974HTW7_XENLA|nr:hypothetical protein XELAEV_18018786mg [Xenopus laevis]